MNINEGQDILDYLSKVFRSGDATTPRHIVDGMLDLIPVEVFADRTKTFLCPATKDGIFLREILRRILSVVELAETVEPAQTKAVVEPAETVEPAEPKVKEDGDFEKLVREILETRIFGIALTYKDYMMSRRTLYGCTDDEDEIGYRNIDNIFYDFTETLSEPQKDRFGNLFPYQYTFIKMNEYLDKVKGSDVELVFQVKGNDDKVIYEKRELLYDKLKTLKNMNFDVIIGNPPYQLNDGGGVGSSAIPIYHKFIQQAKNYNPRYLSMIVPARWFAGGKGLDEFRNEMLNDNRIRILHDYIRADEIFPSVEIKGGVCYFLWDSKKKGDCTIHTHTEDKKISVAERPLLEKGADTFVRFNEAIPILRKVQAKQERSFSEIVSSRKPFGLTTFQGKKDPFENGIKIYANHQQGYVKRDLIKQNENWIDKIKILVPKAWGMGNVSKDWIKPFIVEPNSCCTETYLVIGPFETQTEAENVISYTQTKFFHLIVSFKKITQNTISGTYSFVPLQDFSEPWTDEKLYKKYGLTEEEIGFIESMIKPMSDTDNDNELIEEGKSDE
jgi:site-specific DNA-methyltransferase (adenine-specific)